MKKIKENEDFSELAQQLKNLSLADPGEAFFQRQKAQILTQIVGEQIAPAPWPHRLVQAWQRFVTAWTLPRGLAWAAVLLVIGLGYWRVSETRLANLQASFEAVWQYAVEDSGDNSPTDLADFNDGELQQLADKMQAQLVRSQEDAEFSEEIIELDEMNEHELNLLIQQLESQRGARSWP